jgi:hypothetical protein
MDALERSFGFASGPTTFPFAIAELGRSEAGRCGAELGDLIGDTGCA